MKIRKSTENDISSMMILIKQAQSYFKNHHIDQWQDGYPNEQQLYEDIQKQNSYVLINQDIIGTMYFAIEDDINYSVIKGQWKTQDQQYAVIHRIVVDEKVKGQQLAKQLLMFAEENCLKQNIKSIRIDTHIDNLSMQRFLRKNGFEFCGEIQLQSGAMRIAFEKILNI